MNNKHLLEVAGVVALACHPDQDFKFGAVAMIGGKVVQANNGHSYSRSWCHHAEARLLKKIPRDSKAVIAVVRLGGKGWAMARPCASCQVLLRRAGVRKVLYSIAPMEYGIMEF